MEDVLERIDELLQLNVFATLAGLSLAAAAFIRTSITSVGEQISAVNSAVTAATAANLPSPDTEARLATLNEESSKYKAAYADLLRAFN